MKLSSVAIRKITELIQDNTLNPYSLSTKFDATTKYVYSYYRDQDNSTPTDQDLEDKKRIASLPVFVSVHLVSREKMQNKFEYEVMIRCFVNMKTKIDFQTQEMKDSVPEILPIRMEAEELSIAKCEDIQHEMRNNDNIRLGLASLGMWFNTISSVRPVAGGESERQDYAHVFVASFTQSRD